jgi:tetratricopeptide (TPR) repeat protein
LIRFEPRRIVASMNFADEITRAAGLFEQGNLSEAAEVFKGLAEKQDLEAGGRAIAAYNLAVTYDKMGHPDHAVRTYEYGVGLVTQNYVYAQQRRAEYLHQIGRLDDAIAVWEHLADLEFIAPESLAVVQQNLATAQAQRGARE